MGKFAEIVKKKLMITIYIFMIFVWIWGLVSFTKFLYNLIFG